MGVWYCTREDVKSALETKLTARDNAQVDRAVESGSRAVERLTHRKFYPWQGTYAFDWPTEQRSASYRLWLPGHDLISVTSVLAGTETLVENTDFYLEPANDPPYESIELITSAGGSFGDSATFQHAVRVTGLWGWDDVTAPAGTLAEALDASETAVDVSSGLLGVGAIIKVDSERMLVTDKSLRDTGQDILADLDALESDATLSVTTGSAFAPGETLTVGSERMLVEDVAGNNVIVKRAWDGTEVAAHTTGDSIYGYWTLTVERGALGTTAATHSDATAVRKQMFQGPIAALALAEAISTFSQEQSGYARTIGGGEFAREARGAGLGDLRDSVYKGYARRGRVGAI